jgi:hypothetical protein
LNVDRHETVDECGSPVMYLLEAQRREAVLDLERDERLDVLARDPVQRTGTEVRDEMNARHDS